MNMALQPAQIRQADIVELSAEEIVLLQGDLSVLTAPQRVAYYNAVCRSVGLNPLTKPFDYIILNGKLTLYAKKDAGDQLRAIHVISVDKLERATIPNSDILTVTAYGHNAKGRTDAAIGAVSIGNLRGEALANAMMKAETKAKRRLTLSLAGLGWLDENEVASIPGAQAVVVDEAGEIQPAAEPPSSLADALDRHEQGTAESSPPAETVPPSPEPTPDAAQAAPESTAAPEAAPTAESETTVDAEPATEAQAETPQEGITWDEFKRMARERHILTGLVLSTARDLWPSAKFETQADIEALSDAARLTLWLGIIARA